MSGIRQLAEDLAAAKGTTTEEELAYLRSELAGDKPPIRWHGRRVYWWERLIRWVRGDTP